jgi:hypothetical protein
VDQIEIETWTPEDKAYAINDAVAQVVVRRAVIEQAKGLMMAVYDIESETAFGLLKWRSQQTNTKLRVLAERVMADFRGQQWGQDGLPRLTLDQILITAHEPVATVVDQTG